MKGIILGCVAAAILPVALAQEPKPVPSSASQSSKPAVELIVSPDHIATTTSGGFNLLIKWVNNTHGGLWCMSAFSRNNPEESVDDQFVYEVRTSDGRLVPRVSPKGPYDLNGHDCAVPPDGVAYEFFLGCLMCAYDMRHPGVYTVHVSVPDTAHPGKLLGTSNVVTVTVTQAALTPDTGLGQAGPDKNATAPPFSISINVVQNSANAVPNVVQAGQRIFINVVLTNLSDHSLDAPSAWMGSLDAVYGFDIRDSTGTQLTPHAPPTVGYVIGEAGTLRPCKTKIEEVRIDDFYNFKPGTYEIRAKRCIDLENPEGNGAPKYDESKGIVWSNKITITVIPATASTPQ